MLRVATAGSVDDGKSTLIGRLLFDAKALMADQEAGHQGLGVEQQPADQRRLAVVDGPGGGDPQHQKYPTRLRSSMAASDVRSSARVSPRSVTRVAAISSTTSSSVVARERTAPVQLMSPTVR